VAHTVPLALLDALVLLHLLAPHANHVDALHFVHALK
jgi:hypothetical protein